MAICLVRMNDPTFGGLIEGGCIPQDGCPDFIALFTICHNLIEAPTHSFQLAPNLTVASRAFYDAPFVLYR